MVYRYPTIKVNGKTKLKHRHVAEQRLGRTLSPDFYQCEKPVFRPGASYCQTHQAACHTIHAPQSEESNELRRQARRRQAAAERSQQAIRPGEVVMIDVLSLGAGIQSTTTALMAAHGDLTPMPAAAVFADTGWEPKAVYDHLDWLCSPNVLPFPVIRVSAGNIRSDLVAKSAGEGRFASVPFFMSGGGMGRRQCTKEYKIYPIRKAIRDLLGVPFGLPPAHAAVLWLGISTDEAARAKPSGRRYYDHRFPLLEAKMSRTDCVRWLAAHEYPTPPKSACIGCPFHNDAMWSEMRESDPTSWADAVEMDRAIRTGGTNMRQQQFMHRSLRPLDQVQLEPRGRQSDLFINECEGMCGV